MVGWPYCAIDRVTAYTEVESALAGADAAQILLTWAYELRFQDVGCRGALGAIARQNGYRYLNA